MAAASTAALLAGSLGGAPAYADSPAAAHTSTIHLRYAARDSTVTVTRASTVREAVAELHLAVDGNDHLKPGRDTRVTDGMSLVIDVVSVTRTSKKQTIKYKTVSKKTSSLMKGQKKVVRHGRTGKLTRTSVTTTVNGRTTRVVKTMKVNHKPRNKIVKVGTSRLNSAHWKQWNKIARCESGGRWNINTGNGYYGGLQFNLSTWRSAGGSRYAKYPNRATKREQIDVANRLYAKRGFSPWSCRP